MEYFLAPSKKQSVNPKEHLTGEALAVLFHGGLSPVRAEAASAHLRVCDECLARYESIRRDELASPLPAEVAELAPVGLKRLQRKLREVAPPHGGYLGTVAALRSGGTRSLGFDPAAEGVPPQEAFRGHCESRLGC